MQNFALVFLGFASGLSAGICAGAHLSRRLGPAPKEVVAGTGFGFVISLVGIVTILALGSA